jgi:hypothetical protein
VDNSQQVENVLGKLGFEKANSISQELLLFFTELLKIIKEKCEKDSQTFVEITDGSSTLLLEALQNEKLPNKLCKGIKGIKDHLVKGEYIQAEQKYFDL